MSDWLKFHAQFIVTNYCQPNLEEVSNTSKRTSTVQHNCQEAEQLFKKT